MAQETIGKRIARLRQECGWTQQSLAERLALSRVAVSHIEMDLSLPSERTITLLAGLFHLRPTELAAGTTYPPAKADRLPHLACCYTALEHQVGLLFNDLDWLARIQGLPGWHVFAQEIWDRWLGRLETARGEALDQAEKGLIARAGEALRLACRRPA
jgi:transcriptional regulator with XRE-family HTH domain